MRGADGRRSWLGSSLPDLDSRTSQAMAGKGNGPCSLSVCKRRPNDAGRQR